MTKERNRPFLGYRLIAPQTRMLFKAAASLLDTEISSLADAHLRKRAIEILNNEKHVTQPIEQDANLSTRDLFRRAASAKNIDIGQLANDVLREKAIAVLGNEAAISLVKRFQSNKLEHI